MPTRRNTEHDRTTEPIPFASDTERNDKMPSETGVTMMLPEARPPVLKLPPTQLLAPVLLQSI